MMQNKRIIPASMVGNVLEFYDFSLFGFLAPILALHFFPSENKFVSLIQTFLVFATGFLTRPIGGLIFGYLGDKKGRKFALSLSILLMSIPTALIGLLPSYESIGLLAPGLLVFFRLCQGLCTGGEYNGAAIFALEHTPPHKRGLVGGFLTAASISGALLGSSMAFLFTLPGMPSYAWRIPFLLGIVAGLIGFYIRRSLPESPEFQVSRSQTTSPSLLTIIRENPLGLFIVFGIASICGSTYYTQLVFINSFLTQILKVNISLVMGLMVVMTVFTAGAMIVMGALADRIGPHKLMLYAATALFFLGVPIFCILQQATPFAIVTVHLLLILIDAAFSAPSHVVMLNTFPPHQRYIGIATAFSLGMSIFGGYTPAFFTKLIQDTGVLIAPGFCLMFYALIGGGAVMLSYRRSQTYKLKGALTPVV